MQLAIASDLHVHELVSGERSDSWLTTMTSRSPATNNPIVSLLNLIDVEKLRPDCLICPGDITNRASVAGLWAGLNYLKEVVQAMGDCPLVLTPGNHDLVTSPSAGPIDSLKELIRNQLPISHDATSRAFKHEHFAIVEVCDCSILVLDTTAKAIDRASARRGVFDEDSRDRLRSFLGTAHLLEHRVAVLHHHPMQHSGAGVDDSDVLDRGDELLAILADFEFSLVVHGHKHQARLGYGTRNDSPAVLASGSLSWVPQGSLVTQTRNLFHMVELNATPTGSCAFAGSIRTWQFVHGSGWQPASLQSTKFPHRAGFGCRRPTRSLAADVAPLVLSPTPWKSLVMTLPELNFVAPDDLEGMFKRLELDHSIDISFDRAGNPHSLTPL